MVKQECRGITKSNTGGTITKPNKGATNPKHSPGIK